MSEAGESEASNEARGGRFVRLEGEGDEVRGFGEVMETVQVMGVAAGKMAVDLAKVEGGWWKSEELTGRVGQFGAKVVKLLEEMKRLRKSVGGEEQTDFEAARGGLIEIREWLIETYETEWPPEEVEVVGVVEIEGLMQGEVMSHLIHELGNAVMAVMLPADLVSDEPQEEDKKYWGDMVVGRFGEMEAVVGELRNMVAGRLEPGEISRDGLEGLVGELLPKFLERQILVLGYYKKLRPEVVMGEGGSGVKVRLPEYLLESLMENVAQNAVKAVASREEEVGVVELEVDVGVERGQVEMVFRDNGTGPPKELTEKGFEPGKSVWKGKSVSGTGRGMAALSQILGKWGGEVLIRERQDGESGAEMVLRLPGVE